MARNHSPKKSFLHFRDLRLIHSPQLYCAPIIRYHTVIPTLVSTSGQSALRSRGTTRKDYENNCCGSDPTQNESTSHCSMLSTSRTLIYANAIGAIRQSFNPHLQHRKFVIGSNRQRASGGSRGPSLD